MKSKIGKIFTILFFGFVILSLFIPVFRNKEVKYFGIENENFQITAVPEEQIPIESYVDVVELEPESVVSSTPDGAVEQFEDTSENTDITEETSSNELTEDIILAILKYDTNFINSLNIVDTEIWGFYIDEKTLNSVSSAKVINMGVSEDGLSYGVVYELSGSDSESGLLKITMDSLNGTIVGIKKYIND